MTSYKSRLWDKNDVHFAIRFRFFAVIAVFYKNEQGPLKMASIL